jgi:hypothetical protein
MLAEMTFGLYHSTPLPRQIISFSPNQSASRMSVPRFPGSEIFSRTSQRAACSSGPASAGFCSATKMAALLVWKFPESDKTCSLQSITSGRLCKGRLGFFSRKDSVQTSVRHGQPARMASATAFAPSTRNKPSASRSFF